MTPETLISRIDSIADAAQENLFDAITNTQKRAFSRMTLILKELELDELGYIKNSKKNRDLIQKASEVFNTSLKSGYTGAVQAFVGGFDKISAANAAYFAVLSEGFKPNAAFIKSLKTEAIRQIETLALNEGLVSSVKSPLMGILNRNVNAGGSFSGFLEEVRGFIVGNDKEGRLLRYARTWTSDALFNYSRALQQSITNDLGLEWFYYSGGAIKTSRDFCRERFDQYWHKLEIESWAEQDWAGRHPDTTEASIFVFLGGYNCRHSLIPVSESVVPREVLSRIK